MIAATMYELGARRSCIRELFEYGLRQAAVVGKENVMDFSIGNPSIPTPAAVTEAFDTLVRSEDTISVHGYTPAAGDYAARKAVADNLPGGQMRRSGQRTSTLPAVPLRPHLRHPGPGGAGGGGPGHCPLLPGVPALCGDERLPLCDSTGGHGGLPDPPDELERRITPHTQALIVNSPNNPSGVVYTPETLAELAEVLTQKSKEIGHPIYIISDEPYRELVYDGADVPYLPSIYPNTVICYSYSKILSLPGERIGYVCVPDSAEDSGSLYAAIAGAARTLGHVCAPSLQQKVVAQCVDIRPNLAAYDRNRTTLYDALTAYGYQCVKPQGAFYLFPKAPGGNALAFSERAKSEKPPAGPWR